MIATRQNLSNKDQTARKMYQLTEQTAQDLEKFKIGNKKLSELPLIDYFEYVKNIPYRQDPRPREIIARPGILLRNRKCGLDCKKKSLLIAAWSKLNNIPYRFVATSRRQSKKIHHVLPQLFLSGRFIDTDATYPQNSINQKKYYTKKVILTRS